VVLGNFKDCNLPVIQGADLVVVEEAVCKGVRVLVLKGRDKVCEQLALPTPWETSGKRVEGKKWVRIRGG
jgi:hypothetical protein